MSSPPDDVLRLLRRRGRHPDPSALDSLMRGVAAAPEGLGGPEWVELVEPDADNELTRRWRPGGRSSPGRRWSRRRARAGLAPGRPARRAQAPWHRRLRRAACRRASGRVRAAPLAAAGLAHRLQRLGGPRHRAGRPRGDLRRRPLHPAVRGQVDAAAFVPHQIPEQSPEAWIAENLPQGGRLGFDPWLQTVDGYERFARACQRAGGDFVAASSPIRSTPSGRDQPPAAAGAGAAAAGRVRRRDQRRQARAHRRRRSRPRAPTSALITAPDFDRLAAQRPRRRRAAHAVRRSASRCCTPTARRSLHRPPQAARPHPGAGSATR